MTPSTYKKKVNQNAARNRGGFLIQNHGLTRDFEDFDLSVGLTVTLLLFIAGLRGIFEDDFFVGFTMLQHLG